jgi:hypothetical membrane protein
MKNQLYALCGLFSALLLWSTYFVMASLRPEFNFKYKAISELGSIDAPNLWFWNVLGYMIPGLLIAIFAYGLYQYSPKSNSKTHFYGLLISGLMMTFSGIFPADMDHKDSLLSILHMVGSYGSYIAFLFAAFSYPKLWKKEPFWKSIVTPTYIATGLTFLFGAWAIIFPHMPAVGQRFVFLFYFLWIILSASKLYKAKS